VRTSLKHHRLARHLAAAAVVMTGAGLVPAAAQAGTYELHQCSDPAGVPAPLLDWSASKGDIDNNCLGGRALQLRFPSPAYSLPNSEIGGISLDVPASSPDARIVAMNAEITSNPTSGSNSYLQGKIGSEEVFLYDFPVTVSPNAVFRAQTPGRSVALNMICNRTAQNSECRFQEGRPFDLHRLTLTLEESVAPTATFSGTLVGTGPKAGTHTLVVTGNDADSGVKAVELRIGGRAVGAASFAAACQAIRWQVCPRTPSHSFTVDTTGLADGSHAVSAVVTDHAGNSRTESWGDIVVRNARVGGTEPGDDFDGDGQLNRDDPDDDNDGVVDGSDPAPFDATSSGGTPSNGGSSAGGSVTVVLESTGSGAAKGGDGASGGNGGNGAGGGNGGNAAPAAALPVVAGPASNGAGASETAIVTVYGKHTRQTRTVGYGRRVAMTGRVTDAFGRPIVGAVLSVEEQAYVPKVGPMPGAAWKPAVADKPVVTGRDGSFRYVVPAGHSRVVRVGYRARVADSVLAATQDLVVQVVGKATLRASRTVLHNGQKVRFSGRLLGGHVPTSGVNVVLQAKTARGWVTFKTVRAGRSGRFAGGYRFHATSGTRVYVFRAVVKADSGYPFLPPVTNTTRVTVHGR
jgi:hypothetical protein